jgi:hypothetical protein
VGLHIRGAFTSAGTEHQSSLLVENPKSGRARVIVPYCFYNYIYLL